MSAQKKINSHISEFNRILKRLTCKLATYYPSDATIYRVKERILTSMSMMPLSIIDEVGPHLYKYRYEIYAENTNFFIENDYDSELKRNANSNNSEKINLVSYVIPKVKEAWRASDEMERSDYQETVQDLLDIYVNYLILIKAP